MSAIVGINTCKMCGKDFSGPRSLIVAPGRPGNSAAAQASMQLMQHVIDDHKDVDQALQVQSAQFLGVMRLLCFTLYDEATAKQRDFLRWYVHQATLNAQITDQKMLAKADEVALQIVDAIKSELAANGEPQAVAAIDSLQGLVAAMMLGVLTEMRTALQEPGKYPGGPTAIADLIAKHQAIAI